jgi:hypothetical protein
MQTTDTSKSLKPFHVAIVAAVNMIAVSRRSLTAATIELKSYGKLIETSKIPSVADVTDVKRAFKAKLDELKEFKSTIGGEPWVAKTFAALDYQMTHTGNGHDPRATDKQVIAGAQTGTRDTGMSDGRRVS